MRKPPALKEGDEVIILSTARAIEEQELETAIQIYESWGLRVRLGKTIGARDRQFAGDDALRANDFQMALDDPDVKAIFCARGGYGTIRIMDRLDFTKFTHHPKWLVGYSDVTVLHAAINQYLGIQTLHATMPVNFSKNTPEALNSLQKALWGESLRYTFQAHPFNRSGEVKARMVGGNMSIVYALLGTKYGINPSNRMLFLEDLDEYLYHIDRMAQSMEKAGKWKGLSALVLGGLTDMNDNEIPFGRSAEEIIAEHVAGHDYPVCFNFPAGHLSDNRSLILGAEYQLKVSEEEVSLLSL
jgi:muramoyltetrapeptide carboxypeptidase